MKTIQEYLSGSYDSELRVLVAEARGWRVHIKAPWTVRYIQSPQGERIMANNNKVDLISFLPPYPTSRDTCEELLADLTDHEMWRISGCLMEWNSAEGVQFYTRLLRATARQICVAYLIVKGVLK